MDVHKVANNCISGSYISIAGLTTSPRTFGVYVHLSVGDWGRTTGDRAALAAAEDCDRAQARRGVGGRHRRLDSLALLRASPCL